MEFRKDVFLLENSREIDPMTDPWCACIYANMTGVY